LFYARGRSLNPFDPQHKPPAAGSFQKLGSPNSRFFGRYLAAEECLGYLKSCSDAAHRGR
jgi:hypothetical protein